MDLSPQLADRAADVAAGVSAGGALTGATIGHVNEWLQAGAFIIAMVSGAAAALYHITRWRADRREKRQKES